MIFNEFKDITRENFPTSTVSSMKTGGAAKLAFFPTCVDQFVSLLKRLGEEAIEYKVIGNASNVLFPDDCSDRVFVFTGEMSGISLCGDNKISAECGAPLSSVSLFARKNSLSGLEFAFGIPGSCGGGVFMNAGAYGGEMSAVLESVTAFDTEKNAVITLTCEECRYSYRHSIFMENRSLVILSALFCLADGDEKEIEAICREQLKSRREKQPLEYPSCGSAFKRPVGSFAGKLIQDAGLKGFAIGGAEISEKHAGFIINKGGASSEDVKSLMKSVQKRVFESSGVMLEPEIEII